MGFIGMKQENGNGGCLKVYFMKRMHNRMNEYRLNISLIKTMVI